MTLWNQLRKKEKYYFIILTAGFLIKYNYLMLKVLEVPARFGLILKNIFLLYVFIFILLPYIRKKKNKKIILLIYSFFTVFFMANYWYDSYFGSYISINDIGRGESLLAVIEMFFLQILKPLDLLFFLDIILLFFVNSEDKKLLFSDGYKIKISIVIIAILLLSSQMLITNFALGNYSPYKLYQMETGGFANVYGVGALYLYEAYREIIPQKKNVEEVNSPAILNENELNDDKEVEEYNIITIQVESLDKNVIDKKHKGQELTPFLNELKDESMYFNNIYAQHVNGSYNADLSFLTSFYPLSKHYTYNESDMKEFDSLPRYLNEEGYENISFVNRKTFFHRHKAFPDLGFDKFYGLDDYDLNDKEIEVNSKGLGINDYDLFRQSVNFIEDFEEPFFTFLITSTGHGPFKYYDKELSDEFSDIDNRLVRDYFRTSLFVDRSIEMFYNRLEEKGILDDTILIVYGDHTAEINEEEYSSYSNFSLKEDIKPPESIPLIIKHPEYDDPEVIEKAGSTTDLAPTLLDLMGFGKAPKEFMGNSLLGKSKEPVLFLEEKPLILYRDIIYRKEVDKFETLGKHRDADERGDLPSEKEEEVDDLIKYIKAILKKRNL